jgi:iron(III) transport system permease protein
MHRLLTTLVLLFATLTAGLAYVLPTALSLLETLQNATLQAASAAFTPRRLALLLNNLWLAAGGTLVALLLGSALAAGLTTRGRVLPITLAVIAITILLTPPYLIAYAWGLVILEGGYFTGGAGGTGTTWLGTTGRALLCLGTWLAPLTALALALGHAARIRPLSALIALDGVPLTTSLLQIHLPLLRPFLLVAALVSATLALTEYSVPHLCLVSTLNTDILAEVQLPTAPGALLQLAAPLVLLVLVTAASVWFARRSLPPASLAEPGDPENTASSRHQQPRFITGTVVATAALVLLAPFIILATQFREPAALVTVWQSFPDAWPSSALAAAVAGLGAATLAITLECFRFARALRPRPHRAGRWLINGLLLLALLGGILPPALVGDAVLGLSLELRDWRLSAISEHWPILSVVGVARFGFLALLIARLVSDQLISRYAPLAAQDGVTWSRGLTAIVAPLSYRPVALAALACTLLALGEVAASLLVRPPGTDNLAVTLLNHIHFGRDSEIIVLCLSLVLAIALSVTAAFILLARHPRRTNAGAAAA